MPLILAIESDRRQAARITAIARDRLNVELIVTESAERAIEALAALAGRTPDLMLIPQLMLPKDETALNERLRELDAAGMHVQTLMIPVLAASGRSIAKKDGLLSRFRRGKTEQAPAEDGCDPGVFAAQISEYLERAAEERAALAVRAEDEREYREAHAEPAPVNPVSVVEPVSVVQPMDLSATAVESIPFLSESVLAAMDELPEPRPAHVAVVAEPAPSMTAFLDAMLDPVTPPPSPPDVAAMDLSGIVEMDDPPVKPEPLRAVPLPVDIFELEEPSDAAPTGKPSAEVPDVFAEFVSFDELGVMDGPAITLGEFAPIGRAPAAAGNEDAVGIEVFDEEPQAPPAIKLASVLDSLELLDGPEISDAVDFQPERRERRAAASAARAAEALGTFFEESEPDPVAAAGVDDIDGTDAGGDLWTPLPVHAQQRWPRPEGPTVKAAVLTPAFDAPPDPGVEFAPLPPDRTARKRKPQKPVQDEWGLFDPAQCGFAALLAKLDEVTDKEEAEQNVG